MQALPCGFPSHRGHTPAPPVSNSYRGSFIHFVWFLVVYIRGAVSVAVNPSWAVATGLSLIFWSSHQRKCAMPSSLEGGVQCQLKWNNWCLQFGTQCFLKTWRNVQVLFPHFKKIVIKGTGHKICYFDHFQVYNPVASITLTMLGNHHTGVFFNNLFWNNFKHSGKSQNQ